MIHVLFTFSFQILCYLLNGKFPYSLFIYTHFVQFLSNFTQNERKYNQISYFKSEYKHYFSIFLFFIVCGLNYKQKMRCSFSFRKLYGNSESYQQLCTFSPWKWTTFRYCFRNIWTASTFIRNFNCYFNKVNYLKYN